jgi:hypothetical protein
VQEFKSWDTVAQPGFTPREFVLVGLEVIVGEVAEAEFPVAELGVAVGVGFAVSCIVEAAPDADADTPRTFPTLEQKPLSGAMAETPVGLRLLASEIPGNVSAVDQMARRRNGDSQVEITPSKKFGFQVPLL